MACGSSRRQMAKQQWVAPLRLRRKVVLGAAWLVAFARLAGVAAEERAAANLSQADEELEGKFRRLVDWLQDGMDAADFGVKRPPTLAETFHLGVSRFGRTLVAARDVEAGATITLLPLTHVIHAADYSKGLECLSANVQGAVYLARQRALGEGSPWAPYMALMPGAHPDLPKYWPELWEEHLQGSMFHEFVNLYDGEVKNDYERVKEVAGMSWEDYQWGADIRQTRSVYWDASWVGDNTPRPRGASALVPLFDLLAHGSQPNADFKFDSELQAMRLYAKRSVSRGDELLIPYFDDATRSNTEVLQKWGFAVESAKKMVEVRVAQAVAASAESEPPQEAPGYALELTARDGAATAFLGHLRALADRRPVALEGLPEDWMALPDPRTGWLYYWSTATGGTTWERPGHPLGKSQPFYTPASFWGVEAAALTMAKDLMERRLAEYPQTLAEDEQLLAGYISDMRMRFLVMFRRDEKLVLHWWLRLIAAAMDGAPGPQEPVDPTQAYLNAGFSWSTPRLAPDEL
mmetsp:Transcript_121998/g.390058  ORF Transcript_121998/g.390058 Transcript_121998/m.390058 type:complete len:520 (+) Transcript_121998:142-1701(+)